MPSEEDLVQIRPKWYAYNDNRDVNIWSRVHPRFEKNEGCIVDLGCLGWNKEFTDKTSDNWSGYFFGKKRVVGVDPQEIPNEYSDFFKGFISNFSGKANLSGNDSTQSISKKIIPSPNGVYEVLTWKDFCIRFNINSISILKINIEGAEWDLLESFEQEDLQNIDQICVSFHNFLPEYNNYFYEIKTKNCVNKLLNNNYTMIDLGIYGWKLFLKDI
jgi:hypothetical protein